MDPQPSLPPGARPRIDWRRLTRSPRGAAGLVIVAAALLLWPFAGLSWIPWLVGLGVLVLIHLVRLDGLLRGWAPHVAGLAVVIGLMLSTGPWSWALALSIGVLLAGLAQLPWWRLAAVGAVLCVISGTGFAIAQQQEAAQVAAQEAQTRITDQGAQGAARPNGVLPVLLNRIAQNVPAPICNNLLSEPARAGFVAAQGTADCAEAVGSMSAKVVDRQAYARADAPMTQVPGGIVVDACRMTWGSAGVQGPQLGKLTIGRKPGGTTYVVTAFAPC